MDTYQAIIDKLQELGIDFEIVTHPPALSTEEADRYIEGLVGVRTKTFLLTNKKKSAFYLLTMDDQKRMNFDAFKEVTGEKRIKMASADVIKEKLNLEPGVVSILGLLNNSDHDIQIYFDRAIMSEAVQTFHPAVNTKTIFLKTSDVLKFVDALSYPYKLVDLP